MADNDINIETMTAQGPGENGVVTLTTDDNDAALRALTDTGFKAVTDDAANPQTPRRAWSPC